MPGEENLRPGLSRFFMLSDQDSLINATSFSSLVIETSMKFYVIENCRLPIAG